MHFRTFVPLAGAVFLAGACTNGNDARGVKDSLTVSVVAAPAAAPSQDSEVIAPAPIAQGSSKQRVAAPSHDSVSRPSGARSATAARAPIAAAPPRGPRRVVLGDIDLTGIGYDRGNPSAPVVVIDFSDFGCPYCGKFTRETYPVIEREYVNSGRVFFKYVPFVVGMFPHSAEATRAAECAAEQGRFWPMADHLYEAQKAWKGGGDPRLLLTGIAGVVGADTTAVSKCYADRHTDARTARATDAANRAGVRVTPSFIVDERPIEGALPLAEFRKVLDAALLVRRAR